MPAPTTVLQPLWVAITAPPCSENTSGTVNVHVRLTVLKGTAVGWHTACTSQEGPAGGVQGDCCAL